MVKHIVMFKFKNREKDLKQAEKMLNAIPGDIVGCMEYKVSETCGNSPFEYDLILSSGFDSFEALAVYAGSRKHQEFLKYISEAAEKIAEANYTV